MITLTPPPAPEPSDGEKAVQTAGETPAVQPPGRTAVQPPGETR